jgi:hypothetical protein
MYMYMYTYSYALGQPREFVATASFSAFGREHAVSVAKLVLCASESAFTARATVNAQKLVVGAGSVEGPHRSTPADSARAGTRR